MTGFPCQDLNRDLSLPFVQPVQQALRDCFEIMLGVDIEFLAADPLSQTDGLTQLNCLSQTNYFWQRETQDTLSAVICLAGEAQGLILFYYPPATALAITRKILGMEMEEISESLVHDCIGEVANMVGGGAKSLLTSFRLNLGLPIVPGSPENIPLVTGCLPQQWFSAHSEMGRFQVGLSLLTAREPAKELSKIDGTETTSNNKMHFSPKSALRQISSGS